MSSLDLKSLYFFETFPELSKCLAILKSNPKAVLVSKKNILDPRNNETKNLNLYLFFKNNEVHYSWNENSNFEDFNFSEKNSFSMHDPISFQPVFIPKPWGQEIWFTGCEKRGVSLALPYKNSSEAVPLFYFFDAFQSLLLKNYPLVLVKILDPLDVEVYGDLYFEMHEQKNEVYIVTQTKSPNPSIRIGIHPEISLQYENNKETLQKDILESIENYEIVRRKIDAIFDEKRIENKIPLNDPISNELLQWWSSELPVDLRNEEIQKRKHMESFTYYLPLNVSDVVQVPTFTPHALQHGVQVVEFQTPTYERAILSFAQKVLTQKEWNTKEALQKMRFDPFQQKKLEIKFQNDFVLEEWICQFSDFCAYRVTLSSQQNYFFSKENPYHLIYTLNKDLHFLKNSLEVPMKSQECFFIPKEFQHFLVNNSSEACVFLVIFPKN